MIDCVRLEAPIETESCTQEVGFLKLGKLTLVPNFCKKTRRILKYECLHDGLLFSLVGDRLKVSNSLHKFFKGNNYSDFSFSNLRSAVKKLEYLTEIRASNFKLSKLEFGLNIDLDNTAKDYLPLFLDYKGRERDKMRSNQIWYGVKFPLTEFALKFYDKTLQTKIKDRIPITENRMRIEMQLLKMRSGMYVQSLEDLASEENLKALFAEFVKKLRFINCDDEINFSSLSSRERELLFAGRNPSFWNLEKSLNINTAKSKRKQFKEIKENLVSRRIIEVFIQKLERKFEVLMAQ